MWKTEGRSIGPDSPVFLIAEAGINHNGNVRLAHRLIDAAVDAGADAVKFQTFITEEVVSKKAPLAGHHVANIKEVVTHFDLIKKLELPFTAFTELKEHCEEKSVVFISTPYDIPSAEFLIRMNTAIIKNASSEMTNLPLLDVIRQSKIPVILSTGMSTWDEIVDSVNFIGKYHSYICIMKCTSNYPSSPESINLRGIAKLKKTFPQYMIGFSDHSLGNEISLASIGLGVCVIERHFTLDKNLRGPDHKASMTPDEFKLFVQNIRKATIALGSQDWSIQDEEISQRKTMQKAVYARHLIPAGSIPSIENVKFLRPQGQISPKDFFLKFRYKPVTSEVKPNMELTIDHFQE
jgi:sialic acid synthase SpsE